MRAKLGVADAPADVVAPLVEELLTQMQQSQVDHTSFYRRLSRAARGDAEPVRGEFIDLAAFDDWPPGGARSARMRTRWTGSTRSTFRATTSWRRC